MKSDTPIEDVPSTAAILATADPEIAFLAAVEAFNILAKPKPGIHPSAIVATSATLGANVHLGAHVTIGEGTVIGDNVAVGASTVVAENCVIGNDSRIYPNVTIYPRVKLGQRVVIHAGCVLGADGFGYKFRNGKHVKVPHIGSVEIGDDVELGANSCIDRGTLGPTRIGRGTKIDNLVQIAHNNNVGQHCILCGQSALAGSCTLEDYVILGGQVGLADHAHMGRGARAGAKAGVQGFVPAGQEVWGLMATERKKAFASYAALRRLPLLFDQVRELRQMVKRLGGDIPDTISENDSDKQA